MARKVAELAQRKPAQLSGGQAQRVALARAVLLQPQVYSPSPLLHHTRYLVATTHLATLVLLRSSFAKTHACHDAPQWSSNQRLSQLQHCVLLQETARPMHWNLRRHN